MCDNLNVINFFFCQKLLKIDPHFCILVDCMFRVMLSTSTYSLAAVSVDRYWAVFYPFSYRKASSKKYTVFTIAFCWLLGFFKGIFSLISNWNMGRGLDNGQCGAGETELVSLFYIWYASIPLNVISTLICIVSYARIIKKILEDRRNLPLQSLIEFRISITLGFILLVYILLILPYSVVVYIMVLTKSKSPSFLPILIIGRILIILNSAVDPFIYAFRVKRVQKLIRKCICCRHEEMSVTQRVDL